MTEIYVSLNSADRSTTYYIDTGVSKFSIHASDEFRENIKKSYDIGVEEIVTFFLIRHFKTPPIFVNELPPNRDWNEYADEADLSIRVQSSYRLCRQHIVELTHDNYSPILYADIDRIKRFYDS